MAESLNRGSDTVSDCTIGPDYNTTATALDDNLNRGSDTVGDSMISSSPTALDGSLNLGSDTFNDCSKCSTADAVKFCLECNSSLCAKCIANHNQWLGNHQLLPLTDHALSPLQQGLTEMCHLHRGMLINTYCNDHDDICCSQCAGEYHSPCHTEPILKLSKGIKHSTGLKDAIAVTGSVVNELRHAKDENKKLRSKINEVRSADIVEIQNARKEIRDHFDQIEADDMGKVSAMLKEREQAVNQLASELDTLIKNTSESQDELKNTATEYDAAIFVKIKKAEKVNKTTHAALTKVNEQAKTALTSSFNFDETVLTKTKEIVSFGQFIQEDHEYIANMHKDHTIKLAQDVKECDITDSCFMDDGTILLVDRNNETLKQFDQDFNLLCYCTIPGKPYGVCNTDSRNTVALTVMEEKKIQFVYVYNNRMQQGVSFRVSDICRGIAHSAGELFVSCGGSQNEGKGLIAVHNVYGVFLRQIGANHLQIPIHIVCAIGSGNKDRLFVTDSKLGAVILLDKEGNFQGKFRDPDIREAKGLCMARSTRLFVTGKRSNNIMQLDTVGEDTSRMHGLVGRGGDIVRPCSLLFDPKTMRLIVTMSGNSIKIFTLS